MNELLHEAVQDRRQTLIDQLIQLGVFKIGNKHLYEMSLSELEEEYQEINSPDNCQPAAT
ncbi:Fur-regulated basic protein FbpA [Neobacillus sp. Marseille-QA0830]